MAVSRHILRLSALCLISLGLLAYNWYVARDPRRIIAKLFPNLGEYEVLDDANLTYNCYAWALGQSEWVWVRGGSITDFDELNGKFGYRRLPDLNYDVEPDVEKITLYVKDGIVTHQARQDSDGTWTSKLGGLVLIRHAKPESLVNDHYGAPAAVYARKRVCALPTTATVPR